MTSRALVLVLCLCVSATHVTGGTDTDSNHPTSRSSADPASNVKAAASASVCLSDPGERSCRLPLPASPRPAPGPPHTGHIVFVSIAIKGHAQPLLRVASEMKDRGYRVTFATHDCGEKWVQAYNLPFLSAGAFPIPSNELRVKFQAIARDGSNLRGIVTMFTDIYVRAARPMFDALLPQLDDTQINMNAPDLLVLDMASIGAHYLAQKLHIPYVLNSPSLLFDLTGAPSYVPAWGTGFHAHMSLWHRCMNLLFPQLLSAALTAPFLELNKMRNELNLPPFRSPSDWFQGARILLNTAFGLEYAQPLSPLVDAVGPILPVPGGRASNIERHPLDTSLAKWLDEAMTWSTPSLEQSATTQELANGVVYVNLGTMAYIDAWQAKALMEGLLLGYKGNDPLIKVLWILPTDQHAALPSSMPPLFLIKTPSPLLSNLEVLSHPAIGLVISHCSMGSAQEALVMGKQLLCIPFFVDQPDVAARIVDSGAGLLLDKTRLSPLSIHAAVTELRTNGSYARAAKRVGALLKRAGGTLRAVEVVDAALRLGSDHLMTLPVTAPWHKTMLLDVWAVYAALICLSVVCVRMQWLLLYYTVSRIFCRLRKVILDLVRRAASTRDADDEAARDNDE